MTADKSVKPEYIESIIAQLNLQLIDDLRSRKITIREAENMLYNLEVYLAVKKRKLSRACKELILLGMELEDVEDFELDYGPSFETLRKLSHAILPKVIESKEGKRASRSFKRKMALT